MFQLGNSRGNLRGICRGNLQDDLNLKEFLTETLAPKGGQRLTAKFRWRNWGARSAWRGSRSATVSATNGRHFFLYIHFFQKSANLLSRFWKQLKFQTSDIFSFMRITDIFFGSSINVHVFGLYIFTRPKLSAFWDFLHFLSFGHYL